MSDIETAQDIFRSICPNSSEFNYLVVDGEPKAKSRPRVTKKGVYTPSSPQENAIAWMFKQSTIPKGMEGGIAFGAVFYRSNRQRIDIDNLIKLVLDAGTKAHLWKDDRQVVRLLGMLELDKEKPRTLIVIGRFQSSLITQNADHVGKHKSGV